MTLSSKDRYAIIAMFELATRDGTTAMPLVELSRILNVSVSYLEQLFSALRRAGLVASRRGPTGGYLLGREPDEISISDIVAAIRGWEDGPEDARQPNPADRVNGITLWSRLSGQLYAFLNGITLADLLNYGRA
jgi:Rrf2 family iron-sulfur cluster assembly transcriptional regulator